MFTMQLATPCITQAATHYALNNMHPVIHFEYADQAGNVTQMEELNIDVQCGTPHDLIMAIGRVIPYTIDQFKIPNSTRYVMIWKLDTSSPQIRVTLKTALFTTVMDTFEHWEKSFRAIPAGTIPWEVQKV